MVDSQLKATGPRPVPFEGRDELDRAWQVYRKALRGLLREGYRSDPETLARVPVIAAEATEVLLRLASDANAATLASKRNEEIRRKADARVKSLLRRSARRGVPRAAEILARMEREARDGEA